MQTDENLIRQVKKMFEEKTCWGNSDSWTNQDFLQLSELIRDETGITLSHVTLKRVWGKVKYESLPNTHTLNTLAQYLGYDNWRDFAAKHPPASTLHESSPNHEPSTDPPPSDAASTSAVPSSSADTHDPTIVIHETPAVPHSSADTHAPTSTLHEPSPNGKSRSSTSTSPRRHPFRRIGLGAPILILILALLFFLHGQQPPPQSQDYTLSSTKVVTAGLPNSVIFDYDASRSPDDSVIIQQSWDVTRRVRVPKAGHQYSSIYYYPDFYHATLQVHGQVVRSHNLLIKSNGWLPLIEQDPVPVYFKAEEATRNGKIGLSLDQIRNVNIPMQPVTPIVMIANVRDFGEIYSDHFTFETSVRNDYSEGSAACQLTRIYLLCEGTAIWIPLCAKGCVSATDLYFTYYYASGKREDLSNFGVDFSKFARLRIESDSGRAKIFVNNQLAYIVPAHIRRSKIIGIEYRFEGTGSVDYVYLSNGKITYRDDFDQPTDPPITVSTPADK
ncbi:MAG TPA: hypothetical protein VFE32_21185 [Puia sp.]|jgi:hypothetical protein|nr:hypothetical protein [Puia sp.]